MMKWAIFQKNRMLWGRNDNEYHLQYILVN